MAQWLHLLQEFNIIIIDRPIKENIVEYFLSRIKHEDNTKPVDDTFLDERLFVVFVQTPWFADISNYLAIGKIPNHLFPHEKHRILVQSSNYS